MKKKTVKIISTIMLVTMILFSISNLVLAATTGDPLDPSQMQGQTSNASTKVQEVANIILGIVQVVAVAVAVIMLIVLAVKYISASPEGKADIKKSATLYIVGAVLLFASTAILGVLKEFATSAFGE